jgi:hypothetical protein
VRTIRLCVLSAVSFPPASDTLIDDIPRHTSWYKLHCDTQYFYVLVPALVVEEEHLLVVYPAVPVYAFEVGGLVTRVDLQVIEVVDRASRRTGRARYFKKLEHLAAEFRCMCP